MRSDISQLPVTASSIHRILGAEFDTLPPEVRYAHDHAGALTLSGLAQVTIGKGMLRSLICAMIGLPRGGRDQGVTVILETDANGVDFWQRDFSGRRYRSHLAAGQGRREGLLVEQQGAMTNLFAISVAGDRILFTLQGFALCGMPVPQWLSPRCDAFETAENGRFVFDIAIDVPVLGRLIHYRGALSPAGHADNP